MTTTGISFQTTNGTNLLTFDTTGNIGILTGNPLGTFDISSPYFVIVPKGTTGQRPGNYTGCIRFNSTLGILEGYRGGSSSGWWPLYNQGSDDMKSRISFDDGLDANYNIHFYTNNTKRMTLTEDGNLCIGSTSGSKKINVSGAINSDNLYYNGTLFKTIPDYIYQNLTFNDTYGSRNSGYYDTHSIDVSQNLDVSGTPTINTKLYVYNYYNQPYSTKIRGDFETSRLELTDMNYNNSLNIGASTGNLPYSRNGDVRVNTQTKHFQVYYNNNWRTSKSLQRPFMAFESNGTASIPSTNALNVLQRVNLNGGKFITNDSTTFNCLGTSRTTSRFIINKPGLYLLTIGVYFSNSNHKFRYILFKSNGNNTAVTSPDFYSPGTRDYLFNDTGLSSGPMWSNVDSNQESQVNGANYYHQVQDFGEMRLGEGLNEKTIPFILESGKSITMFAAYQSSFQKLTMKFLRLGPTESVVNGTTTTIVGLNSYTSSLGTPETNSNYIWEEEINGVVYITAKYISNGSMTFEQDTEVEVLLVGGGGSGGGGEPDDWRNRPGGGGGGGGIIYTISPNIISSSTRTPGTFIKGTYYLYIGSGGSGVGRRSVGRSGGNTYINLNGSRYNEYVNGIEDTGRQLTAGGGGPGGGALGDSARPTTAGPGGSGGGHNRYAGYKGNKVHTYSTSGNNGSVYTWGYYARNHYNGQTDLRLGQAHPHMQYRFFNGGGGGAGGMGSGGTPPINTNAGGGSPNGGPGISVPSFEKNRQIGRAHV